MLTHIVQSSGSSIFLIDEPDVYLHSDLQRQLVSILKGIGPDIVLATHSTDIISECDADEIVVVSKEKPRAKRLRSPTELGSVFLLLGSSANPILTQLAKTRRALFVEGLDFKIISHFARRLGEKRVSIRSDFAVVPTEGFNPEKVKSLKMGMEHPLGRNIVAGAILDRDFRSDEECNAIITNLESVCNFAVIHDRKELENFVLVPEAIDRLVREKVKDRQSRGAAIPQYVPSAERILSDFADENKTYLMAQFTDRRKSYMRSLGLRDHEAVVLKAAMDVFESKWSQFPERIKMIQGKAALSYLNAKIQNEYKVSVTAVGIIEAMRVDEVPGEMKLLIERISRFSVSPT